MDWDTKNLIVALGASCFKRLDVLAQFFRRDIKFLKTAPYDGWKLLPPCFKQGGSNAQPSCRAVQ